MSTGRGRVGFVAKVLGDAPVYERESCGHNPKHEVVGQLNNSHHASFDDGRVRGREARYAARVAIWKVFRQEDIWA